MYSSQTFVQPDILHLDFHLTSQFVKSFYLGKNLKGLDTYVIYPDHTIPPDDIKNAGDVSFRFIGPRLSNINEESPSLNILIKTPPEIPLSNINTTPLKDDDIGSRSDLVNTMINDDIQILVDRLYHPEDETVTLTDFVYPRTNLLRFTTYAFPIFATRIIKLMTINYDSIIAVKPGTTGEFYLAELLPYNTIIYGRLKKDLEGNLARLNKIIDQSNIAYTENVEDVEDVESVEDVEDPITEPTTEITSDIKKSNKTVNFIKLGVISIIFGVIGFKLLKKNY